MDGLRSVHLVEKQIADVQFDVFEGDVCAVGYHFIGIAVEGDDGDFGVIDHVDVVYGTPHVGDTAYFEGLFQRIAARLDVA